MSATWKNYQEKNKDRFLDEMLDLLRIPSVSARSEHKTDMVRCAELVKQRLLDAGCDKVEVMDTDGHPAVYGEKIIHPSKPTVLVYGHYDVQPADPLELWNSGPFDPIIKDGKVYARGSADDKGQFYMHVKALEMMVQTKTMSTNIKFLIEGEEEVGSPNLGKLVADNKDLLKADVILISDSSMLSMVANPITILAKMIAGCHDKKNHVTIPGFYDDVAAPTKEEKKLLRKAPFNEQEYKDDLGVKELWGEKGFTTNERTGIRPTLELNGIWGGYQDEGAKTVLPSKATAKISARLVPNQSSKKMTELLINYFQSIAPASVTVKAFEHHGGEPYVTPIDSKGYKAAEKAVKKTFGKKPIPVRGGGSIPISSIFEKELGIKIIFMGFGLDNDNLHSPNEKYNIENYYKGIETIPYFHKFFAETD